MTDLRLTIPARSDVPDPRVETRPGELRRFLDSLPFTDAVKACGMASAGVAALNRQALSPQHRLPLVELYRQTFRTLIRLLERPLHSGTTSRQSRQAGDVLQALRGLARELAFGYKIIVTDGIGPNQRRLNERTLQTGILRAIRFLGLELLFDFHAYTPAPAHVWREINQLYDLALEREVADSTFIDDENSAIPSSSIAHVFKQIALTARSDPYHLASGEVWRVHHLLDRWAELAKVIRIADNPRRDGMFLIDLRGASAPAPLGEDFTSFDPRRHRLLDTHDLARWIDDQIRELELGNLALLDNLYLDLPPREAVRLLRYLLLTWWHCPTRQHDRQERLVWVDGACGLASAHRLLSEKTDEEPSASVASSSDAIEISRSGARPQPATLNPVRQERWRLLNHSTGGVAVAVRLPCDPSLRVGQLVVLRTAAEQSDGWLIGAVRWLSQENEDEIKVGVQYLSDNATPVTVQDTAGGGTGRLPGLLVEVQHARRAMPPQLVTPHGFYQGDREFLFLADQRQTRVRASKLIESTNAMDRFYFERLSG